MCLTALSNFDAEKERAELGKQLDELEQLEKQFIVKVLKKDFQTTVFCLSKLWEDKLQKACFLYFFQGNVNLCFHFTFWHCSINH